MKLVNGIKIYLRIARTSFKRHLVKFRQVRNVGSMRKQHICKHSIVALETLAVASFAWTGEQEFIVAATNAIANKDIVVGAAFGEELISFSNSSTNEWLSRTISIVDAYRNLCIFENTASESNLVASMNISSNITSSTASTPNDWHFWAGRLLFAGAISLSADESSAYSTLTNALLFGGSANADNAGTNAVMRSLIDAFEMEDLSGDQAFRALAGVSAAISGHSTAATNIVSDLPQKYRGMVEDILADAP